ncbi:MAG: mitochondrial fission ELM1 family protein [Alphaproteobacteria bacterium]
MPTKKKQAKKPLVWVLADDRAGNVTQAIGVAEALELPYEIKNIAYTRLGALPNWLRSKTKIGISEASSEALQETPLPDLVIGAGRRTAPIGQYLKKISEGKTKHIQIMYPGYPTKDIDLIATPEHDLIKDRPNLIKTLTAPHQITENVLKKNKKEYKKSFENLPHPLIAVFVGGKTKKYTLKPSMVNALTGNIYDLASNHGGSILMTTSRRTDPETEQKIIQKLSYAPVRHRIHSWRNKKQKNPYRGFLACADVFVITGDSVSMISEAISTGKPLYIYAPEGSCSPAHRRLHQALYERGIARPLIQKNFTLWAYEPANAGDEIAEEIKKRFL